MMNRRPLSTTRPKRNRTGRTHEVHRPHRGPSTRPIGGSTAHAEVVADMLRCERDLTVMLARVRERLDAELVAVRNEKTPFKDLAFEVQQRLELPTTADELERVARLLRQRTTVAHRRARAASIPGKLTDAEARADGHHVDMTHDPFLRKRRIVEEEYGPPPGMRPDVEDLNDEQLDGDDAFDDGDELDDARERDHDLGDSDEPR